VANEVKQVLQRYKELQDIIAILGIDELSDETRWRCSVPADSSATSRSRSSSPSSSPASPCVRPDLRDGPWLQRDPRRTIRRLPRAFVYMKGTIDDVIADARGEDRADGGPCVPLPRPAELARSSEAECPRQVSR